MRRPHPWYTVDGICPGCQEPGPGRDFLCPNCGHFDERAIGENKLACELHAKRVVSAAELMRILDAPD